eukprot:jgi/Galph1/3766/GphlegSOOS_G2402.1
MLNQETHSYSSSYSFRAHSVVHSSSNYKEVVTTDVQNFAEISDYCGIQKQSIALADNSEFTGSCSTTKKVCSSCRSSSIPSAESDRKYPSLTKKYVVSYLIPALAPVSYRSSSSSSNSTISTTTFPSFSGSQPLSSQNTQVGPSATFVSPAALGSSSFPTLPSFTTAAISPQLSTSASPSTSTTTNTSSTVLTTTATVAASSTVSPSSTRANPSASASPSLFVSPSSSVSATNNATSTPTAKSSSNSSVAWPTSWPSGYYATNIAANVQNLSAEAFNNNRGSFKSAFDIGISSITNSTSGDIQLNYSLASNSLFPSFSPYNGSRILSSRLLHNEQEKSIRASDQSAPACALYLQTLSKSSKLASRVQQIFNSKSSNDLQTYLQAAYGGNVKVLEQAARVAQLGEASSPVLSVSNPVTSSSSTLSTGAIVGIAVGGGFGFLIVIAVVSLLIIRKRRKSANEKMRSSDFYLGQQKNVEEQEKGISSEDSIPNNGVEWLPSGAPPTASRSTVAQFETGVNASLRELVRECIFKGMIFSVDTGKGNWKVLILDRRCLKIVYCVCKLTDIVANGVSLVESLHANRERLPRMSAIYFVDPNMESIKRVVADFERPSPVTEYKSKAGNTVVLQYGSAHLFTTNYTPEPMMNLIRGSPGLVANLQSFTELHVDFLALEDRVFSLDLRNSISELFCPDQLRSRQHCDEIASKLMTVCSILKERPRIRCLESQPVARCIAELLYQKLDEYESRVAGGLSGHSTRRDCKSTTFIIVDRTIDLIEPLIHEYGYQAMCEDMLVSSETDTIGSRYAYSTHNEKGALVYKQVEMDENEDWLWKNLRHLHVAEAIEELTITFNKFLEQDKTAQLQLRRSSGGSTSVHDLKSLRHAVRNIPNYSDRLSKFSLHTQLLDECMRIFYERNLERLSSLEQDFATGYTADGKPVKDIKAKLIPVLRDDSVNIDDKLRLITLSVITQPMTLKERRNLLEISNVPEERQTAVLNLSALGVSVDSSKTMKKQLKDRTRRRSKRVKEQYELSRYQPVIQEILEDVVSGRLSRTTYPIIGTKDGNATSEGEDDEEPRSRRRARSHRRRSRSSSAVRHRSHSAGSKTSGSEVTDDETPNTRGRESSRKDVARPRYLIFIAGGVTSSEMRVAYELSSAYSAEIFIGGSCILNPKKFVEQVEALQPRYVENVSDFFSPVSPEEQSSPRSYSSGPSTPRGTGAVLKGKDVISNLEKKYK